jgi:tetratricopeptide (TPR) repeat protein
MKYTTQTNILIDYSAMVETIREAEQSRNFDLAMSAFKDVWSDFEVDPDFSQFSLSQQAELYRLSGYFLSNYGKLKNRVRFQERGKNLLTKAIESFSRIDDFIGVADAQNVLAMCYIHEGAILEAEAILEQTAVDFLHDKLNLVYLQNRGNLLITKLNQKKYDQAFKIIDEIIVPMEFCTDKKACHVFHEKAGNLFRRTKQFSKAIHHYNRAIDYAEEINNIAFISSIKNNLAFLYFQAGKLDLAGSYINNAVEIAKTHNLNGLIPHYLDTKAAIYFDEGNFPAALETINEAIEIFQKGDDAGGLTETLWNKCKFLLYLNRKEEAIKLFAELAPIANERMGEFAVDNISKEFADLIHVKKGGSLIEETQRFRRVEIISAIRKTKYELPSAAEMLKISLEDLTRIIDQEFPELYEEINIERFTAINSNSNNQEQIVRRKISRLFISMPSTNLSENVSAFYISEELMQEFFGISQDVVMAFESINEISTNEFILVQNKLNGVYLFGKVQYDEIIDLYFLTDQEEPFAFTTDEVELIGKAVAYLPFSEIDNEKIEFKKLNF